MEDRGLAWCAGERGTGDGEEIPAVILMRSYKASVSGAGFARSSLASIVWQASYVRNAASRLPIIRYNCIKRWYTVSFNGSWVNQRVAVSIASAKSPP